MLLAPNLQKNYFNARMRLIEYNLLNKIYLVDELYFKICHSSGDNVRLLETTTFGDDFRKLVERILADESETLDQEPNRNVCEVRFFVHFKVRSFQKRLNTELKNRYSIFAFEF